MHLARRLRPLLLIPALAAGIEFSAHEAVGQHNVQPSQTGLFFDDLRARARQADSGYAAPDEASYRFQRSQYRAMADPEVMDPMAEPMVPGGALDDTRRVGAGLPVPGAHTSGPSAYYSHSQPYGYPFAQYAGGPVRQGNQFSPTYVTDPFSSQRRNLQVGPFGMGFGLNIYGEYTDNIARSPNKVDEFIVGTTVGLSADWPITRWQRLSLNVGVGYEHYFNNPQFNRRGGRNANLNLTPNSSISFEMLLGNVYVTVYDSFGINDLRTDLFGLDESDFYYYFYNDLGIAANWQINSKWSMQYNINRSDQIPLGSDFNFADRSITSFGTSVTYSPNGAAFVGAEGSVSHVDYRTSFQNDGYTYSYGLFAGTPITRNISIRAGAGVQHMRFDSGGDNQDDNTELDDFYYNVALQHQINRYVSHSLSFGHESSLNNVSNFRTTDYIRYGVGYAANRTRLSASVFFENDRESGGFVGENIERVGFNLYGSYQLTRALNLGAGYSYADINSELGLRSYDEHSFQVDLNYVLTQRWRAGLGYRYYMVDTKGTDFDFDQNRFLLNFYYNL